jgi:hypothetical protein
LVENKQYSKYKKRNSIYIEYYIEFLVSSEGYIATANKIKKTRNIISEKIIEKPS